jgi:hypothetical protein
MVAVTVGVGGGTGVELGGGASGVGVLGRTRLVAARQASVEKRSAVVHKNLILVWLGILFMRELKTQTSQYLLAQLDQFRIFVEEEDLFIRN